MHAMFIEKYYTSSLTLNTQIHHKKKTKKKTNSAFYKFISGKSLVSAL